MDVHRVLKTLSILMLCVPIFWSIGVHSKDSINQKTRKGTSSQSSFQNAPPLIEGQLKSGVKNFNQATKLALDILVPENTPIDSSIFLKLANLETWDEQARSKYQFEKKDKNLYRLEFEEPAGTVLQFKFNRGGIDTEEVDERGRDIGSRVLYIRDKTVRLQMSVANWKDLTDVTKNEHFGYWNTVAPDFSDQSNKPKISLNGEKTVYVSKFEDYVEPGAIGLDANGKDISNKISISHSVITRSAADVLITYQLEHASKEAIPESRLVRIVNDDQSVPCSLRPVGSTGSHYGYIEQLPSEYGRDPETKFPLFIYHHGAGGEAKSINLSPEASLLNLFNSWDGGPARIAMRKHWNSDSPLIVLSPQRSFFKADIGRIDDFLKYAIRTYQVDPNRIYMGGFSAGGFISWEYAIKFPNKVAAIIPMSGALLNGPENICNASDVAVWAFHSIRDPIVDVSQAREAVTAYNNCSPTQKARLTLFENIGHPIHQQVLELRGMNEYIDSGDPFKENLYLWMMNQSK